VECTCKGDLKGGLYATSKIVKEILKQNKESKKR